MAERGGARRARPTGRTVGFRTTGGRKTTERQRRRLQVALFHARENRKARAGG